MAAKSGKANYIPSRGDFIWLQFDPQAGYEQAGHRPALVLSPIVYNQRTGLLIACPITSQIKGYPFEVEVAEPSIKGVILTDQVKNLDWRQREARFIATAGPHTIATVLEKIAVLLD
ncbi:MAG TPA: endoribonuclease MazF [Candidatus Saccharimonadia bacterium]|nr:endoribonuclease MazF [Candidatus Saccharimonadia bacterium]